MRAIYIFILIALLIGGCNRGINKACIGDKCYNLELVDSQEERQVGLMEHNILSQDAGMWFIFEEDGGHSIWMKNMRFPIDIIWIDSNYNVVDVKRNAEPCVDSCEIYSPSKDAKYVLEVNVDSKINIGDRVEIR